MAMSKRIKKATANWKTYKIGYSIDGKRRSETVSAPNKLAAVKFIMNNYPRANKVG